MDVAFREHHPGEGAAVSVVGAGKGVEYASVTCRRSILAKLEFTFNPSYRDLEGHNRLDEIVAKVVRKVARSRPLERRLISGNGFTQE